MHWIIKYSIFLFEKLIEKWRDVVGVQQIKFYEYKIIENMLKVWMLNDSL